jgi:hypothetical protein
MPFIDRFEGSERPFGSRTDLCFQTEVSRANAIKDDWGFVLDDPLRYNIAYALQEVHFDILLVNNYAVFGAIEKLKLKHALVQIASVAEAVLQYMLQMVEDDPRVQEALGNKWSFLDFADPTQGRIEIPDGIRVVAGIQHKVQPALDRNTKMQTLIKAAKAAAIIAEQMATDLDDLREQRNRVHIKALTAPEYSDYTPKMVNDALDTLERFRPVALRWTFAKRQEAVQTQGSDMSVPSSPVPTAAVGDLSSAGDDILL